MQTGGMGGMTAGRYGTDDERWQALQQRAPDADGLFVYSVASTGIYCRPTCPSRLALRRHVAFHDTGADAERAGFRACKRCRPDAASRQERHAEAVTRACRIIETAETPPTLATLAAAVSLSPHHFHRRFTAITGVTPRQYAASHRAGRVKTELRAAGTITDAIYGAGFNASGRFYEQADDLLGMTPGDFRRGGQQITIAFAVTLRRRLILMADRRHSSGHWCYPDAAAVAGLRVEALMQGQFSRAKAETLVRVAQRVERGELPLDAWQQSLPADAGDTLLAIRGIGPWTVNYTLLRGFAEADRSLHGDAAVATALHRLTGSPAKPNPKQVQGILERYRPYRSLAAAHLWASLHLSA